MIAAAAAGILASIARVSSRAAKDRHDSGAGIRDGDRVIG